MSLESFLLLCNFILLVFIYKSIESLGSFQKKGHENITSFLSHYFYFTRKDLDDGLHECNEAKEGVERFSDKFIRVIELFKKGESSAEELKNIKHEVLIAEKKFHLARARYQFLIEANISILTGKKTADSIKSEYSTLFSTDKDVDTLHLSEKELKEWEKEKTKIFE